MQFKNEYVEMWLEGGIIFVVYEKNAQINLKIAQEIVAARLNIANGMTCATFSDLTKGGFSADKEARKCFSNGDAVKYVSCGAILIRNQIQKLIGNAFLAINKPPIPAKLFTDKNAALRWIEHYKNFN